MGLIQKPPIGIQLNNNHPSASEFVGCWIMNEKTGGTVFDLSHNDINGINYSAAWVPDGLYFDGASRIALPKLAIGNRDTFTISARVNGAAGGMIYSEGYTANTNWAIFLGIDADPPYGAWFYYKDNNVWKALISGTIPINDGWHTVNLVQRNKSYRSMYVDGNLDGVNTEAVGDMSTLNTANIGVLERTSLVSYFVGTINNVYINKCEFSDADVKLYNSEPYTIFEQDISLIYYAYKAGWIGTINGISSTSIAKINGVSIENIAKVNGVASA